MKETKILISDYDNTFYKDDNDIKINIAKVKEFQEKGNIFVIATGRSYDDFYRKVNQYQIPFDYAILNHGGTIIDNHDNILYYNYFPKKYNEILPKELLLDKSEKSFCCSILESRVSFDYGPLTKVYVKYSKRDDAIKVTSLINQKYGYDLTCYLVGNSSIEIISNLSDKAKAIEFLINKLGFVKENIYTIGDSYTDIEMIKKYHGYAMNNSVKELLNVTTKHVDSVNILLDQLINLK